jgi:hypothetical protein
LRADGIGWGGLHFPHYGWLCGFSLDRDELVYAAMKTKRVGLAIFSWFCCMASLSLAMLPLSGRLQPPMTSGEAFGVGIAQIGLLVVPVWVVIKRKI